MPRASPTDQDQTLGNIVLRMIRNGRWSATYQAPTGFITVEAESFEEAIDCALMASFLVDVKEKPSEPADS